MSPSNSLSGDECGISLGSQDSVIQDLPDSEIDSDYVPSEMSEDRAFLASDTEQLSYLSDGSSSPQDPILSIICDYTIEEDNKTSSFGYPGSGKIPIKAIAKREMSREMAKGRQSI